MKNLVNKENQSVLFDVVFKVKTIDGWKDVTTNEIFENKKVIIFSLPGAFTPTCSSTHLPRYEELYDVFKNEGVDEIYCLSVNDSFVMDVWGKEQKIEKVKMLPDGNGHFTEKMGMLVNKENLGFGKRSWRYSMLVVNGVIEKQFIEEEKEGDPFEYSDADTMINYLNEKAYIPPTITIFTKDGCPFCRDAKVLLTKNNFKYSEIVLSDADRQKVLRSVTGLNKPTVPQIFINGARVDGLDGLHKYLNQ